MQVSVPETAQIVSRGVGAVYRFDWSRLLDCSLFEGTYFCCPSVIKAVSSGRCVSAITSSHFKDKEILEKCPLSLADEGLRLVRLSDDKIYFDLPHLIATFKCEASDTITVEGRGMIFLNPGCSLDLGPYYFTNERGGTYSANGQIVSMQRQIIFHETPSEGGMTGIYRWLGISSGAIHSHWSYHLYALAAINGLCLLLNLAITCIMRRKINQTPTSEQVYMSSLASQSSNSEEDSTGKRKGVSMKVRYVILFPGEDLYFASLQKNPKESQGKHRGKYLLGTNGRQENSAPTEPGRGASGRISPVGADLPSAQIPCVFLVVGYHSLIEGRPCHDTMPYRDTTYDLR